MCDLEPFPKIRSQIFLEIILLFRNIPQLFLPPTIPKIMPAW